MENNSRYASNLLKVISLRILERKEYKKNGYEKNIYVYIYSFICYRIS